MAVIVEPDWKVTSNPMRAAIWLQPTGAEQETLRSLIAGLARRHGTAAFQPHLTVCGAPELDPAKTEAAAAYVRRCRLLPLTVRKTGISYSTTSPLRAVVIEIENTPELRSFREELCRIFDAPELQPTHISLLYTIGKHDERPVWWSNGTRLQAIAEKCAARIVASEFILDHPILVACDEDWTKITTWKVVRKL